MEDTVYLVWYKDIDIYRSHALHGIYRDKFDAIQYVKDLGARQGVDVQSEEDDFYIRNNFINEGSKLIASYCIVDRWYTVESTKVK